MVEQLTGDEEQVAESPVVKLSEKTRLRLLGLHQQRLAIQQQDALLQKQVSDIVHTVLEAMGIEEAPGGIDLDKGVITLGAVPPLNG